MYHQQKLIHTEFANLLTSQTRITTQAMKGMRAKRKGVLLDQLYLRPSSWPPGRRKYYWKLFWLQLHLRNSIAGRPILLMVERTLVGFKLSCGRMCREIPQKHSLWLPFETSNVLSSNDLLLMYLLIIQLPLITSIGCVLKVTSDSFLQLGVLDPPKSIPAHQQAH